MTNRETDRRRGQIRTEKLRETGRQARPGAACSVVAVAPPYTRDSRAGRLRAWLIAAMCGMLGAVLLASAVAAQEQRVEDRNGVEIAVAPAWECGLTIQSPRSVAAGGWVEFTVPLPRELERKVLRMELEPAMPCYLGPAVAPGVRIGWAWAPEIAPLRRLECNVRLWDLGEPGADTEAHRASRAPAEFRAERLLELRAPEGAAPGDAQAPSLVLTLEDGTPIRHPLTSGRLQEVRNDPLVPVLRWTSRIPRSQLVADFFVRMLPGRILRWELFLVASDSSTTELEQSVPMLRLETPIGIVPVVHDARACGATSLGAVDGRWAWKLLERTHLGDAQGQAWHGSLLLFEGALSDEAPALQAELEGPLLGLVHPDGWRRSGRFGPWGELPTMHPLELTAERRWGRVALEAELERWRGWINENGGDPWGEPRIGLSKRPANTGDQEDFGACSLAPCLALPGGGPLGLLEARFAAYATARRPGYNRAPDGELLELIKHADCVYWGQSIHYHPNVSPYQHGKAPWHPAPDTHGWHGWDNEHVSLNGLAGTYLLTGSPLLRHLIECNVEAWLFGATIRPGWPTTNRGASRSVGRTLSAMAWAYACTGDSRILQRMTARLDTSFGDILEAIGDRPEVLVLNVHGRDGRKLGGRYRFWMPWQEALGLYGLDAAARVTGSPRYKRLALEISRTLTAHGWWLPDLNGTDWKIGDAIRYLEDGSALSREAYLGPWGDQVQDHRGTDFDLWAFGAMRIASRLLAEEGDELATKADSILAELERRALARQGGFWRAGRWAATK